MSTLTVLDAIVARYGRATVTDPVALAAALRAVTEPPPEAEIAALVGIVGSDALGRLRTGLAQGTDTDTAVDGALTGTDDPAARWALTHLGAALGLLPGRWPPTARRPRRAGARGRPNTPARRGRHRSDAADAGGSSPRSPPWSCSPPASPPSS